MKLGPNVTRIEEIAKAAELAGADALSAINTLVGMAIDIKTRTSKIHTNFGGLSGPAIKPVAIANVHKIFKSVKIPIIGIGGVSCLHDVIEFLLAGASLVQIGTMNYINPNIGPELKKEFKDYLEKENIKDIKDLIGGVKYHSN
jgi:dihydroorotate dehydrogenase (NAD+) catalytic subunit